MHVTFGRVSASRWETTSYQLRDSGAVAFNGGLHRNPSRHLFSIIGYHSFVSLLRISAGFSGHTSPERSLWLSARWYWPLGPSLSNHTANSHMITKRAANYLHQHASLHLWRGRQRNWFVFFFSRFLLLEQFSPTTYRASNQTTDQKAKTGKVISAQTEVRFEASAPVKSRPATRLLDANI